MNTERPRKPEKDPQEESEEISGQTESVLEQQSEQPEVTIESRTKEEMLKLLKERHLLVDDGYDYESLKQQKILPTMFHGTSEYLIDSVKKYGLKADSLDLNTVTNEHQRVGDTLRWMIEQTKKQGLPGDEGIHLTMVFRTAENHAKKGPEIIENLIARERIVLNRGEKGTGWELDALFPEDSYTKRLLLSSLDPKPVVLGVKPKFIDLDKEINKRYGPANFFIDSEYRKIYLDDITRARESLIKYLKGEANELTDNERLAIWEKLRSFSRLAKNEEEARMFTAGEIAEMELRDGAMYEIIFKKVPASRIKSIEKISKEEK